MYRVVFYCPDKHIEYDGNTPYRTGVGGGITARVRMAKALCKAGHEVVSVVNCPRREQIDGVEYIPLGKARKIEGDVLIANTSGGAMDLRPLLDLETNVRLRLVWAQGTIKSVGLEEVGYDYLYVVSNFMAGVAHSDWGIPRERIFVVYNAYEEELFSRAEDQHPVRDPFRLVYFSHPSKGLDTAIAVLKQLRAVNPRFHLLVFGGLGLWGQEEIDLPEAEGLIYKGLFGQLELAHELMQCSYSICLQSRQEPFGMVVTESMRAGCVVFASPVGAYVELIQNGEDGFLIGGNPQTRVVQNQVTARIVELLHNPETLSDLRRNAQAAIWDCETMAHVWTGHWDCWFKRFEEVGGFMEKDYLKRCSLCEGKLLPLADGNHCVECGFYFRYQKITI